jgi:hypothetical protein
MQRGKNARMKALNSVTLPKRIAGFWPYVLIAISMVGLAYSFWTNYR